MYTKVKKLIRRLCCPLQFNTKWQEKRIASCNIWDGDGPKFITINSGYWYSLQREGIEWLAITPNSITAFFEAWKHICVDKEYMKNLHSITKKTMLNTTRPQTKCFWFGGLRYSPFKSFEFLECIVIFEVCLVNYFPLLTQTNLGQGQSCQAFNENGLLIIAISTTYCRVFYTILKASAIATIFCYQCCIHIVWLALLFSIVFGKCFCCTKLLLIPL